MLDERPTLRTFEVTAGRLSYRECGDPTAAPVVLLHGSGSDAATWDRFMLRLTAAGYRSVALDLRGHATSARTADYSLTSIRDDVLRLIETLALQDVTLVGHSVGGYAVRGARLATIPVGHRVHSLAPEEFTTEVLAFLADPVVSVHEAAQGTRVQVRTAGVRRSMVTLSRRRPARRG